MKTKILGYFYFLIGLIYLIGTLMTSMFYWSPVALIFVIGGWGLILHKNWAWYFGLLVLIIAIIRSSIYNFQVFNAVIIKDAFALGSMLMMLFIILSLIELGFIIFAFNALFSEKSLFFRNK